MSGEDPSTKPAARTGADHALVSFDEDPCLHRRAAHMKRMARLGASGL